MYPKTYSVIYGIFNNAVAAVKINNSTYEESVENSNSNYIKVAIIFDCGYDSVYYNAAPILKKYKLKANIGLIPSLIDEEGYMNYNQIADLYMSGWDILNQTYSHKENMYNYSEELLLDINYAKKWMEDNFLNRASDSVIIPYGEVNPYLLKLLQENKYKSVRTSDNILVLNNSRIEYLNIKCQHISKNIKTTDVIKFLEESYNEKKPALLILNKIGDTQDSLEVNKFIEIVEYIYTNSNKYQAISYSKILDLN